MELSMSALLRDRESLVRVTGELDLGTAGQLASFLAEVLRVGSARLVLDVAGVTFMDCTGLGVLLRARNASLLRGGGLRLVSAPSRVLTLLALTGTSPLAAPAGVPASLPA